MREKKAFGFKSPWDLAAAVMTFLLFGNFVIFIVLCVTAFGVVFLDPAAAVATAVILLLGILCHFVSRRKTAKLWRRLLLGGIAANFLIVAFITLIAVMMILAWT